MGTVQDADLALLIRSDIGHDHDVDAGFLERELVLQARGALDDPDAEHFADIQRLIVVAVGLFQGSQFFRVTDAARDGITVIVIEHNLDLIKCADHIIDLGPEGGSAGGLVIAEGTPEQVAEVPGSFTGQYLKPLLEKDRQLRAADAETGVKTKK